MIRPGVWWFRRTRGGAGRPGPSWGRGLGFAALLPGLVVAAQPPSPRSLDGLRAFFQQNCTRCHGTDGSGTAPDGRRLRGTDFTRILDPRKGHGPAEEELVQRMSGTIRNGIFFGLVMPAWRRQLSREEADRLVREVLLKAERGRPIRPGSLQDTLSPPPGRPVVPPSGTGSG